MQATKMGNCWPKFNGNDGKEWIYGIVGGLHAIGDVSVAYWIAGLVFFGLWVSEIQGDI